MDLDIQESKKSLLLKIASEMIEEDGYQHLKIADLAKAASVSMSTVYQHFESKEDIYLTYIKSKIDDMFNAVDNFETDDPYLRLRHYVSVIFRLAVAGETVLSEGIRNNPLFFMALSNEFNESSKKLYDFLAVCIMEINPVLGRQHALRLAYGFNGQLHGYLRYWTETGDDINALTDELCENFLKMVTTVTALKKSGDRQ